MQQNSLFLKNLLDKLQDTQISYHHFAADKDWIVPEQANWTEHADPEQIIICKNDGHLSILHDKQLFAEIMNIVEHTIDAINNKIAPHVKETGRAQSSHEGPDGG